MENLSALISATWDLFQIEFSVFGHTMTPWSLIVFTVVCSAIAAFIKAVIIGD